MRRLRVVRTPLRSSGALEHLRRIASDRGLLAASMEVVRAIVKDALSLLTMRELWRVATVGMAALLLGLQWTASEITAPPFFKRTYGEDTPIYSILSINYWGCMLGPPLVGVLTSQYETFAVALPGMWLMGLAPFVLVLSPTLEMAAVWQVLLTLGEVFWSPRNYAWQATLAPHGREGIFLAIASTRDLITPVMDVVLGRLNEALNPNCPHCQDEYGHFCSLAALHLANATASSSSSTSSSPAADAASVGCFSQHGLCTPPSPSGWLEAEAGTTAAASPTLLTSDDGSVSLPLTIICPSSCRSCPSYALPGGGADLWLVLTLISGAGPFLVWVALPFLRGEGASIYDWAYGVFRPSRLFGVVCWKDACGVQPAAKQPAGPPDSSSSSTSSSGGTSGGSQVVRARPVQATLAPEYSIGSTSSRC